MLRQMLKFIGVVIWYNGSLTEKPNINMSKNQHKVQVDNEGIQT